jgi:hypothetical protein
VLVYKLASEDIVACYGTEDAVQIVNWFYYNLTRRDYNYFLPCYTFTQLAPQSLQLIRSSLRLFSLIVTWILQLFFTYELPVTVSYTAAL